MAQRRCVRVRIHAQLEVERQFFTRLDIFDRIGNLTTTIAHLPH